MVKAYFLDACKDHQSVSVQFFCKKSCCQVFLNDGAGTIQLSSLLKNRDSAAACGNDDLLCCREDLYGFNLYDLLWLRCCKDTSVLALAHLCDKVSFFFFSLGLFCVKNTSNDLLRLCKCFIVWIDDNLCQNCADRFVDPSGDKLSTDGVLKVIADITLAHGGTYGHWCKCIIRMCLTEFIHCGVDHPYLRTVAVGDHYAGSLLYQICDYLRCEFCSCFLLWKCGAKCPVA